MNQSRCLVIFIKYPEKGKVKSRLVLGDHNGHAAVLYRCFIEDLLGRMCSGHYRFLIAFDPPGREKEIVELCGKGFSYRPQTGHDLGMRMVNAFKSCFDDGFRSVIIIGSDCPDLPQWIIEEAFEALQRHGAVIGPSYDGGYYLIGFSGESFSGNYFENIPWSTENVYKETVGRFDKEGVSFHVLPAWRDIDTIDDVRALLKECGHSDFRKSKTMRFLRLNGFAVSG